MAKAERVDVIDADAATVDRSAGELLAALAGQPWFIERATKPELREMARAVKAYGAMVKREAARAREDGGCGHRVEIRHRPPRPGTYQCGCGRFKVMVVAAEPPEE